MNPEHAALIQPSPWVTRFAALVPSGGRVLDLACGGGRHAALFAGRGHAVTAVDRTPPPCALAGVSFVQADLEGAPWPLAGQTFAGVVVTHYLHRPLFPHLLAALAPGGVLIYETFAVGNERFGRPSRADFLLQENELFRVVDGVLAVVAFEDVFVATPKPARMQRIAAVRGGLGGLTIG